MTRRPNRPQGAHNPSQKSLQRWDTEGGAPKGGRARRTRDPAQLDVHMSPAELNSLDAWIDTQPAPRPTRAEAIRRIVKEVLSRSARSKKSAAKAREMVGQEIDRRLDEASVPRGRKGQGESAGSQRDQPNFAKCAATSPPSRRAENTDQGCVQTS
jgi:hypothetical protein